jgi:hypothetical protein
VAKNLFKFYDFEEFQRSKSKNELLKHDAKNFSLRRWHFSVHLKIFWFGDSLMTTGMVLNTSGPIVSIDLAPNEILLLAGRRLLAFRSWYECVSLTFLKGMLETVRP